MNLFRDLQPNDDKCSTLECIMRTLSSVAFTVLFILLSVANSFAREYPSLYRGVRPLGMGGAFVAISDDANALFYNPAGLAGIKSPRASLFALEIESNSKAYDLYKDALDTDFDDEEETAAFLKKYIGDYGHTAISVFPNYTRPRFAFGLIGVARSNLQPRDFQYPKLDVEAIEDAGICAGYGHPLLDGSLQLGASAKYLFRRSLSRVYTVADITTDGFEDRVKDDFEEGSGALLDLGVIYKAGSFKAGDRTGTFQVGLSAGNLVGSGLGDAQDLDPHIDLGVAALVGEQLTLALDYVDISRQMGRDDDVGKRIHLGFEYLPVKMVRLRAGWNQGYLCLGLGLETKNVQMDLLTYGEEIGSYAGQRDDRRYLIRMGFGF